MALKQIAARIEGDVFQGMIFWLHASALLNPTSGVQRVVLEHDQTSGVDDVAVYYKAPGINAGGYSCTADYYQVKYHVDQSASYSSCNFCDPKFIKAKKSLLQRFYDVHKKLNSQHPEHRLCLATNWQWSNDDPLMPFLRESNGALPDKFFTDSAGSKLGKIREEWRKHLGLNENEFNEFAKRLRLGVGYFGRQQLRLHLSDRLALHGLIPIPEDRSQNPYDSLVQQFIMNGVNDFNSKSFHDMCQRERLLNTDASPQKDTLGIRSFMRFAERMEDECKGFVCVTHHFEGRHIRSSDLWNSVVASEIRKFLTDPSLRASEHQLLLDCHSSLAFLAGYELDRKSGALVFPVQKGVSPSLWKPTGKQSDHSATWTINRVNHSEEFSGCAIAISVTRDVSHDVQTYLNNQAISLCSLLHLQPSCGIGPRVVADADHAVSLADNLADIVRSESRKNGGITHLFIAAPNALTFYLGQHRAALGNVQLYEFDFENSKHGSYVPSIQLLVN